MANVTNFLKLQNRICNGFGRHQFTEEDKVKAEAVIPEAREFICHLLDEERFGCLRNWEMHNQLCFRDRFHDDYRILSIMDNVAKKAKKVYGEDFFSFAIDALMEAASADYWYTYEKDWG